MPEWYQKFLDFLQSNSINPESDFDSLYLMVDDTANTGYYPLFASLHPQENTAAGKDRNDLSWIAQKAKPLSKFDTDEATVLMGKIKDHRLMLIGSGCKTARPIVLSGDGTFDLGAQRDASKKIDDGYKWLAAQTAAEQKPAALKASYDDMQAFTEQYGLSEKAIEFLTVNGFTREQVEELPCFKNAATEDAKKEKLQEYFADLLADPKEKFTEVQKNILKEENIEPEDVAVFAFNNGKTTAEYLSGITAERDKGNAELDYLSQGKNALGKKQKEAFLNFQKAVNSENYRAPYVERYLAEYIATSSILAKDKIGAGEDIPEGSPKAAIVKNDLEKTVKEWTDKLLNNANYRYALKQLSSDDLKEMAQQEDGPGYKKHFKKIAKALKDTPIKKNILERYSYEQMKKEDFGKLGVYFPDEVNADNSWKTVPESTFGLPPERAILSLAKCKMLQDGYKLSDVLHTKEKPDIKALYGTKAYEQFSINTPQNRTAMANTYMNALEKSVDFANNLLQNTDSLHPSDIIRSGKAEEFMNICEFMKECNQELEVLNRSVPFTDDLKTKYDKFKNEAEALNHIFVCSQNALDSVMKLKNGRNVDVSDCFSKFMISEYADSLLPGIKKEAKKNNASISGFLAKNYRENVMEAYVTKIGAFYGKTVMLITDHADQAVGRIGRTQEGKNKLLQDFADGTFAKKINLRFDKQGEPQAELLKYCNSIAPAQKNAAAVK